MASIKTFFQLKRLENLLYYSLVVKCDGHVKTIFQLKYLDNLLYYGTVYYM